MNFIHIRIHKKVTTFFSIYIHFLKIVNLYKFKLIIQKENKHWMLIVHLSQKERWNDIVLQNAKYYYSWIIFTIHVTSKNSDR